MRIQRGRLIVLLLATLLFVFQMTAVSFADTALESAADNAATEQESEATADTAVADVTEETAEPAATEETVEEPAPAEEEAAPAESEQAEPESQEREAAVAAPAAKAAAPAAATLAADENNDEETTEEEEDSNERVWIYVNGYSGSDSNDGTEASKAVKSWAKATELLGTKAGGIYICDQVKATNGTISTPASDKQVVKRADGFQGSMFFVSSGEVTFRNIVLDGENRSTASHCISVGSHATLNALSGAIFKNFQSSGDGAVIYSQYKTKIYVEGAAFLNNVAQKGGAIDVNSGSTVTIRSGVFQGNSAKNSGGAISAYGSSDVVNVYNAVMTANESARSGGAVSNCGQGAIVTLTVDGGAIYNNTATTGSDLYHPSGNQANKLSVAEYMLGGGEHHWSPTSNGSGKGYQSDPRGEDLAKLYAYIGDGVKAYLDNPSKDTLGAALASGLSIFVQNKTTVSGAYGGGAIQSNGKINIGRVKANAALEIMKIDSVNNKHRLEGAEFTLYNQANEEVGKATTTEEGTMRISGIPEGRYTLKETKVPENYQKGPDNWDVTVNEKGAVAVTGEGVHDRSTDFAMYFAIENDRNDTDVQISKQDLGGQEVEGAKMILINEMGETVKTWSSTGAAERITLPWGSYTLKETVAPAGYHQVTTEIKFHITTDMKVVLDTTEVDGGGAIQAENNHIKLQDAPILRDVKISKTDLGGNELEGAKMLVTQKDGTAVENGEWVSATEAHVLSLPFGEYTLTEVVAPEGYACVTTKIEFEVAKDGTVTLKTVEVNGKNEVEQAEDGTIILKDAPLPEKTPEGEDTPDDGDKTPKEDTPTVEDETPGTPQDASPKKPAPSKRDSSPKTGDAENALAIAMLGLLAAGVTVLTRKKENN